MLYLQILNIAEILDLKMKNGCYLTCTIYDIPYAGLV